MKLRQLLSIASAVLILCLACLGTEQANRPAEQISRTFFPDIPADIQQFVGTSQLPPIRGQNSWTLSPDIPANIQQFEGTSQLPPHYRAELRYCLPPLHHRHKRR
jgi:hypothetical protein